MGECEEYEDEDDYTENDEYSSTGYTITRCDSVLDERQETILYVASKYVILTSIAIISTQIFLVSAAIDALSFDDQGRQFYIASFSVYFCLLALDCFINALCI